MNKAPPRFPPVDSLPDDNFGVHVENEMDKRRLLWLVNVIGEKKLRASANKRNKYYPESQLFVSVILKRFHLKVPPKVYAAVKIPVYRVYVLVLRDRSAIKIGMTGDWPGRAYSFVKTADYLRNFDRELRQLFDVRRSIAFDGGTKLGALSLESAIMQMYSADRVPSPCDEGKIPLGCGGHTEWFDYSIYENVIKYLSRNGKATVFQVKRF